MRKVANLRKEMNFEIGTDADKKVSSLWKPIALWSLLLIFTFSLGFIPARLSKHETLRQRDAAQANLRLSQLQNRLATAAINAQRGEYEPARIAASDFFTDLRAEIDRQESGFNARQREAVQPILGKRDEIITLLARYDRAAAEQLTDLYLNYMQTIKPPAQKSS